MKITTILPVSRIKYLDRILESLLNQTVKIENLIVVFDGPEYEFVFVRNKIAQCGIENTICVASEDKRAADTIAERRWHIVRIHNKIRAMLGDCHWVFSVEDDGILPPNALFELIKTMQEQSVAGSDVGMVTGVELGRWGLPYVGAWHIDDVYDPHKLTSLESKAGQPIIEEIDACGLYCALIKADEYLKHEFDTQNGLGPDVNLGLFLRQNGYKNYINWNIPVTHLGVQFNMEVEIPATDKSRVVTLSRTNRSTWRQ